MLLCRTPSQQETPEHSAQSCDLLFMRQEQSRQAKSREMRQQAKLVGGLAREIR